MTSDIDTENGCTFCNAFVTAFKDLYTNTIRSGIRPELGKMHSFDWAFSDKIPSLPGLSASAKTGCRWCELLERSLKIPRGTPFDDDDPEAEDRSIIITFRCAGGSYPGRKSEGTLKEIRSLIAYMTAPSDGSLPARWGGGPSCGRITVLDIDDFNPLSESNCQKIRNGIDRCAKGPGHQSCPGLGNPTNPLRLLNVMEGGVVRLEQTDGCSHVYTALSYCWGGARSIEMAKTKKHNLDERTSGFSIDALPPTLRDAVLLTRSLGFQYIWIDALCIVQDCHTEWTSEAQKMMQYYGNARVTIVPVRADFADSGMHMGHDVPFTRRLPGPWNLDCGSDLILSPGPAPRDDDAIDKSPWSRRGWTYQERLNSARVLFVFNDHLRLECRQGSWDTLQGWGLRPGDTWWRFLQHSGVTQKKEHNLNRHAHNWGCLVDNYTNRRLSNRNDRWLAFSGIAEAFSRATGRRIIAGLIEDRLMEDLVSWRAPKPRPRSRPPGLPHAPSLHDGPSASEETPVLSPECAKCANCGSLECGRSDPDTSNSKEAQFPSWSWLSSEWSGREKGVVFGWSSILRIKGEPRSELISVDGKEGNPKGTMLTVSGPVLLEDTVLSLLTHARDHSLGVEIRQPGTVFLDWGYETGYVCFCEMHHTTPDCESYKILRSLSPPLSALLIGRADFDMIPSPDAFDGPRKSFWHFLLIQPLDTTSGEEIDETKYRRIGIMHVHENHLGAYVEQELRSQEPQTVILV